MSRRVAMPSSMACIPSNAKTHCLPSPASPTLPLPSLPLMSPPCSLLRMSLTPCPHRSDPNATFGFRGADAPEPQQIKVVLSEDAAGQKVPVRLLAAKEAAQAAEADKAGAAGAKRPREGGEGGDTLAAKRSRPGEPASAAGMTGLVCFRLPQHWWHCRCRHVPYPWCG